jgi:putative DNA primase/helicase
VTLPNPFDPAQNPNYGPRPAFTKPTPKPPNLRVVSLPELLRMDFKPREMVLHPFLPTQGLAMLYSKRGVGKTFIALGIAVAVASGTEFLRWKAPTARRVLYVDGEMPGGTLRKRLDDFCAGTNISYPLETLQIITPDVQDRGLPDLSTISGQDEIEEHLEGIELLILDNLSALVRAVKENEGEGWLPVQDWALDLRRRGISVLFVHHAGKSGAQRGSSRREDLLDSVVTLKHPSDYSPSEGLRCIVDYEKARGFYGDDARSFEAQMSAGPSGEAVWTVTDSEASAKSRAREMLAEGMSVRDVAEEIGISKSAVQRLKNNPVSQVSSFAEAAP